MRELLLCNTYNKPITCATIYTLYCRNHRLLLLWESLHIKIQNKLFLILTKVFDHVDLNRRFPSITKVSFVYRINVFQLGAVRKYLLLVYRRMNM